jgi:hypothetical protein
MRSDARGRGTDPRAMGRPFACNELMLWVWAVDRGVGSRSRVIGASGDARGQRQCKTVISLEIC